MFGPVTHFFEEFKKFALKGNVVDLAVGVIIGAAFGAVVTSLVQDIMMPPLGWLIGGVDFSDLKIPISEATTTEDGKTVPEAAIRYGAFINAIIKFTIQAFAIFLVVKVMNRIMEEKEAKTQQEASTKPVQPELTTQEKLLSEIRDLLRRDADSPVQSDHPTPPASDGI